MNIVFTDETRKVISQFLVCQWVCSASCKVQQVALDVFSKVLPPLAGAIGFFAGMSVTIIFIPIGIGMRLLATFKEVVMYSAERLLSQMGLGAWGNRSYAYITGHGLLEVPCYAYKAYSQMEAFLAQFRPKESASV